MIKILYFTTIVREKLPNECLPILKNTSDNQEYLIDNNHKSDTSLYPRQKSRILIVDDNEILLKMLNKMLSSILLALNEEFDVISANDGLDILNYVMEDQFKGNLIKCIITDENMEFINGSEAICLLQKLQQRNKIKEIPVIFLTGLDQEYGRHFIKDFENFQFLSKPISSIELEKLLVKLNIISD